MVRAIEEHLPDVRVAGNEEITCPVCVWDVRWCPTWEIAQKSWENHVKNGQTHYEWGFNGKVMEVNG
jgi:hypothetical protein